MEKPVVLKETEDKIKFGDIYGPRIELFLELLFDRETGSNKGNRNY